MELDILIKIVKKNYLAHDCVKIFFPSQNFVFFQNIDINA